MEKKKVNTGARLKKNRKELESIFEDRKASESDFLKSKNTFYNKISVDDFGYVHNSEEATSKVPQERPFIKLYVDDVVVLKGAPASCKGVLFALLRFLKYDNWIISLNKYDKEQIQKEVGFATLQQVTTALSDLKKSGILMAVYSAEGKPQRGVFELNPYLFGRGDWKNNFANRSTQKLSVLYNGNGIDNKKQKEVINEDAIIEFIKDEKDEEKKKDAISMLYKLRGAKEVIFNEDGTITIIEGENYEHKV
ncbi:hypothetical protein [Psychromonas sp. SR45-3]|uniref:hypothetical protein n=1 Tax=Psychromonas sp. SR45-3 TaxID=2760930 RepID=UPI0015FD0ADC|nr:hypothetical protein [Psychromonas sp. SR45-3]MBB1274071.1 hypothetical protein [Psychromonas sp. SR45-3]